MYQFKLSLQWFLICQDTYVGLIHSNVQEVILLAFLSSQVTTSKKKNHDLIENCFIISEAPNKII